MPCFLFTYHAHGTWLPNRSRGYVKRGQGILQPDETMHRLYSQAMKQSAVNFDEQHQRWAIAVVLESEPFQEFETYYIATDLTHIHALLGWRDQREGSKLKALIKGSLTRRFNQGFGRRDWFVEGGSRKQVRSREHFDHLVNIYLPKHSGWKWSREKGLFL